MTRLVAFMAYYVTVLPSPNDYGRRFPDWAKPHKHTTIQGAYRFEFENETEQQNFVKLYRSSKWLPYEFTVSHEVVDEWSINTPQGLENANG